MALQRLDGFWQTPWTHGVFSGLKPFTRPSCIAKTHARYHEKQQSHARDHSRALNYPRCHLSVPLRRLDHRHPRDSADNRPLRYSMGSDPHQEEEKSSTPSTPRKTGTRPPCKETASRLSDKNTKEPSIGQKFHNLSRGHLSCRYGISESEYGSKTQDEEYKNGIWRSVHCE